MSFKKVQWRAAYGFDSEAVSNECVVVNNDPSLTVQEHALDADINVLMKRMGVLETLPVNPRVPVFGDFTNVTDFQSALNAVMFAQDNFLDLPADLRARFENNPQKLLEFCSDEKNADEMEKLGLLSAEAVTKRVNARHAAAKEVNDKINAANAAAAKAAAPVST